MLFSLFYVFSVSLNPAHPNFKYIQSLKVIRVTPPIPLDLHVNHPGHFFEQPCFPPNSSIIQFIFQGRRTFHSSSPESAWFSAPAWRRLRITTTSAATAARPMSAPMTPPAAAPALEAVLEVDCVQG